MTSEPGVDALLLTVLLLRGVDASRGDAEMDVLGSLLGCAHLVLSHGRFRGIFATQFTMAA